MAWSIISPTSCGCGWGTVSSPLRHALYFFSFSTSVFIFCPPFGLNSLQLANIVARNSTLHYSRSPANSPLSDSVPQHPPPAHPPPALSQDSIASLPFLRHRKAAALLRGWRGGRDCTCPQ